MPLSSEGAARSFRQNVMLAVLLAAVAGLVNAAGFFSLGVHTSHMTGQVAAVGEAFVSGQSQQAWLSVKFLLSFVLGAASAAALVELTRGQRRGRYAPALALEITALVIVALMASGDRKGNESFLVQGLCFAMGLQNALVTRISGAVVRTTHLTGVLTDLGMELVHLVKWVGTHVRERGLVGIWHAVIRVGKAPEFERAWLHLALVVSFLGGATIGTFLLAFVDAAALAVPSVLLVFLIVLDLRPRADSNVPGKQ